jgi:hypothetical protein
MIQLTLQIDLPGRTVSNGRTRAVAADFQMSRPADRRLRVLAATTLRLSAGELVYLVGASGSGKSQVLGALARSWPGRVVAGTLGEKGIGYRASGIGNDSLCSSRSPVLDCLDLPLGPTLRLLCLAGLAEPRLWLSPPSHLSAGQADRLALSGLFARAEAANASPRPAGRGGWHACIAGRLFGRRGRHVARGHACDKTAVAGMAPGYD